MSLKKILSEEEKEIASLVREFGSIPAYMIYNFYDEKKQNYIRQCIRSIVREGYVFNSKEKDYLLSKPFIKPDKRMIDALWVLDSQLKWTKMSQIYRPEKPSTLGFVKLNKAFEVVVSNNTEERLEAMKQASINYRQNMLNADEDNAIRYIFVVNHIDDVRVLPDTVDFPCIYAVLTYEDALSKYKEPLIEYYIPTECKHDIKEEVEGHIDCD